MMSVLKLPTMKSEDDVSSIRDAIANHNGVIACQISLSKQQVNIIYDLTVVSLEEIKHSIEEVGHNVA